MLHEVFSVSSVDFVLLYLCASAFAERKEDKPQSEWWNVALDSDVLAILYMRGDYLLLKTKTDGTVCFDTKKGEVRWTNKTLNVFENFVTYRSLVSIEETTGKVSFYSWDTGELQFSLSVPLPANWSFCNKLNPTPIFDNEDRFSFCCDKYICIVNKKVRNIKILRWCLLFLKFNRFFKSSANNYMFYNCIKKTLSHSVTLLQKNYKDDFHFANSSDDKNLYSFKNAQVLNYESKAECAYRAMRYKGLTSGLLHHWQRKAMG